jgi:hypothetical protein
MSTPAIRGIAGSSYGLLVTGYWLLSLRFPATVNQQPSTSNLFLSLLLFMFGGRADHPHDAFAANDLAVFTDSSDACSHLHDITFDI